MRCTPIDPYLDAARAPADLSALRVLLLEDEAIQRALYNNMLRAAGVRQVEPAASGGAALAQLAQAEAPFDVVVTDLKMAAMDGIEFMRRAVKWPVRGFILISAQEPELLACAASVARGYGATILGVLPKPFTAAQLAQLLAGLARRAAPPPRSRRGNSSPSSSPSWTSPATGRPAPKSWPAGAIRNWACWRRATSSSRWRAWA